jgi:hypothetical protein
MFWIEKASDTHLYSNDIVFVFIFEDTHIGIRIHFKILQVLEWLAFLIVVYSPWFDGDK